MNRPIRPVLNAALTGIVALAAVMARPAAAWCQNADAPPAALQPAAAKGSKFLGPTSCALCHNQSEKPNPLLRRDFCVLNEVATFLEQDKHSLAYDRLKSPLGKQMCEKLAIADIRLAKQCLSCHSGWTGKERPEYYDVGVSCESCHGPAKAWNDPHYKKEWRTLAAAKKSELDFIDVRDPVRRARQCFSCHIGDVAEGKVVTHEMYAAGHPPLPGVEIETFVSSMPAHWRSLREKGDFESRADYVAANFPESKHDLGADLPRSKAAVVGGLVALRESLRFFQEQSAAEAGVWPEFAAFDCQSCHHDLRQDNPRPEDNPRPAPRGRPGRPFMPEWPTALTRVGLRRLHPDRKEFDREWAEFQKKLSAFRKAVDARVFGSPPDVGAALKGDDGLLTWLDRKAGIVAAAPFGVEEAKAALNELVALEPGEANDFHSARQIVWAIRTIRSEIHAPYPTDFRKRDPDETPRELAARADADIATFHRFVVEVRTPQLAETDRLLAIPAAPDPKLSLFEGLMLDLPAGQKKVVADKTGFFLQSINGYRADWFRTELKAIAPQLTRPPGDATVK